MCSLVLCKPRAIFRETRIDTYSTASWRLDLDVRADASSLPADQFLLKRNSYP
jgi:hypothetical protein